MTITSSHLTEFLLVKTLDMNFQSSVLCLDIDGGPCYLVAPKLKMLKETKQKHSYLCFKVSAVDIEALDRAFTYYGYSMD